MVERMGKWEQNRMDDGGRRVTLLSKPFYIVLTFENHCCDSFSQDTQVDKINKDGKGNQCVRNQWIKIPDTRINGINGICIRQF